MGVTHVHLLPLHDFGSVDEEHPEKKQFNWGYDRSPEKERWLNELKTQIGEKYVRDFTFHTAHMTRSTIVFWKVHIVQTLTMVRCE